MLTKDLHSLEHRRKVAGPYQVEVPIPRTSLLQHSLFWRTSTPWNKLPGNLFLKMTQVQRN
nr:unnamed protein product [Callosobruchus analis]